MVSCLCSRTVRMLFTLSAGLVFCKAENLNLPRDQDTGAGAGEVVG